MRIRSPLLPTAAAVALAASAIAQESSPPLDVNAMLGALKGIKDKQSESVKAHRNKIIQDCLSLSTNGAGAVEFYQNAVRATQFVGESRAQTQFQEWKKKEAAHLKSHELQAAARLHLSYLGLTLQRSGGAETKDLLPALLNYVQQAQAESEAGAWNEDLLKRNLADSIFVRWYQIGPWLNGIEGWEMTPGNLDGIYQKAILPELRRLKSPKAIEYWDAKIAREAAAASKSTLTFTGEKFEQTRRPALMWSRSEEWLKIGQRNRGVNEMFALIKAYPSHPEVLSWVEKLEETLKASAAPAIPAAPVSPGAPVVPPAPAPAPAPAQ